MLYFPQKRRMESHESIRFCICRRKLLWNPFWLIVQKDDARPSHDGTWYTATRNSSTPFLCPCSPPPRSACPLCLPPQHRTLLRSYGIVLQTHTPFSITSPDLSRPSSTLPLQTSLSPQHLSTHSHWIFCVIITKFNFALGGSGS